MNYYSLEVIIAVPGLQCLRQDVSNFSKNAQMNQSDPIYLFDVLTEGHFLVTNDSNISHIITEGQGNAT